MKKHHLATLLWLVSSLGGQTLVDVRTQTKNVDFSGAASTIPAKSGTILPASCKLGEMFFNTGNAPGQNLYLCAPVNNWTVLVGGGSTTGTILTATGGQFAYYASNGATVGGHTLVAGDIPALNYQAPLTFTGTGAQTVSSTAAGAANNCAKWDANGNVVDAGAPCGSGGGGSITAPSTTTIGNLPQYSNTTGTALSSGLAVVTSVGSPGSNSNIPTEQSVRSAISAATPTFASLTGGTNTTAALLIGSGASLAPTGSGTITATSVAASGVTGLAPSATTDTTNASNIASGTLPSSQLPIVPVAKGGTGTATPSLIAGSNAVISGAWPNQTISQTVLQSSAHIAEGDSITAGYEACGVSGATNTACSYPTLLATDERATVTDRGINGSQACDMVDNQTVLSDLSTIENNPIYTMMIGTNDANSVGAGAYENIFQGCHKAAIAWIAVANKFAANNDGIHCTDTGTWAPSNGWALVGEQSTTNGSTKTCTINTFGGPLYAWYFNQDSSGGTFTYSVDGGAPSSISTATTPAIATAQLHKTFGWNLLRIPGLAAGSHTIKFTVTSPTSSSNLVAIGAIGTPPAQLTYGAPRVYVGGVPRQNGDANSAATAAYNTDALADVNLLAGDGLGVYFVNVRNYLCASVVSGTCYNSYGVADMMTDGLHPNQQGQIDLKQAFEAAEQFTPYVSTNYDASGAAAAVLATSLQKSNNLSDLTSAATARANLGLGTAATQAAGAFQPSLTFTGTGSQTVSATTAGVSGNCARWDANGNVVDAGAPCGSVGGGGSTSWSALTSGTNTSSTFVVGSGASLAASGTGTITATSIPASGVSGTLAAANLPNPTASTLGGIESLAAVSHQWINSISSSGVPSSTQPAFSDISGTVAAAQLPNPSASGLGGIQSAAAVAHQWINAISTAGVPALSQPAFTDVSGTATDAQLPSDQCVINSYSINATSLTGTASSPNVVTLVTLPSINTRICFLEIMPSTAFAVTGASSGTGMTVRLQSSGSTPLIYTPNQDVSTVSANNYWSDSGSMADRSTGGQGVNAQFTFTSATSLSGASGVVNFLIGTRTVAAGY